MAGKGTTGRVAVRLAELGLSLPAAPRPVASYIPAVRSGGLVFVSGQVPFRDGKLMATGRVPSQVTPEAAREAAAQCALNALAILADHLGGDLDRVRRIVKLSVFVACDPDFPGQPQVANGASDLLVAIFGDAGRHARAAVGAPALPLGAPVEVEVVAEVE
jgi:enamine deaminase RidA (YjgF/YER057c/UK114 family)